MHILMTGNFRNFGAKVNCEDFVDEAIQNAIDYCFRQGGGEVQIPAGRYRIRGIRVRSNVTLHLLENAVLEGSRNPQDYFILKNDTVEPVPESELNESSWEPVRGVVSNADRFPGGRYNNGLIRIYKAENVKIIGEKGSVINGKNCFDIDGEEHYRGPHAISVLLSENIVLSGYTVVDSANWAQLITESSNILVENIVNNAGHDGVHITSCDDVIIRNCEFYTGDDCVAGFDNKNILVENCILNTACNALRFGATNALIHHCKVFAPAKYLFRGMLSEEEKKSGKIANDFPGLHHRYNMLSFFTYYADFSRNIREYPSNIVIRDCQVSGADRFLHFNFSGNEPWQKNKPLVDITFENITATDIAMPLTAYGDREHPFTLTINNLDFSYRKGCNECAFLHAANFKDIFLKNVTVRNSDAKHLIKSWSDKNNGIFHFKNVNCRLEEKDYVTYTKEEFSAKPI